MTLPSGVQSNVPHVVCRLQKFLYGLKQSSKQWYAKLSEVLLQRVYQHSENDYSLFYRKQYAYIVVMVVYVDDILLTRNDEEEIFSTQSLP